MRNFDFTPLYRHSVGFDRLANMLDNILQVDQGQNSYPPFNIEKHSENAYRIILAVAGFSETDLNIETKDGFLLVTGNKPENKQAPEYLHKGIAMRGFERRFQLAEHVKVREANIENGLLFIDLERDVPESLKPRRIEIRPDAKKLSQNN